MASIKVSIVSAACPSNQIRENKISCKPTFCGSTMVDEEKCTCRNISNIGYLLFLAFHLLKAVFKSQSLNLEKKHTDHPIRKGFLTALLNPKGMLIYFAILPQFMTQTGNTVVQGFILSYIFIGLIFVVYCSLSLLLPK